MARILVVDDEQAVRDLYREFLGGMYSLDFAENGQDGFNKASTGAYDLVISDLKMPNWNGAETLSVLDMTRPELKFIVVSGFLSDGNYQDALKGIAGVFAQFQKPVKKEVLLDAVARALAAPARSANRPHPPRSHHGAAGQHGPARASEPRLPVMERSQLVGWAGAVALAGGTFAPILSAPSSISWNLHDAGTSDGIILVTIAIFSFVLALARAYKGLWVTGLSALGMLVFAFISLQMKLSDLRSGADVQFADNPFEGNAKLALQVVQVQWGWALMIVGVVMAVFAAATAPKGLGRG